ncbi:unnamed protein product [Symbiodinium natans]|uniref:Uncharacterized protein n=1 Tax=Symbiodinium natans TaxID=878477 RepID=A0A812KXS5_9DINO|nr:unnamed protein product [Symbiodinium natans]
MGARAATTDDAPRSGQTPSPARSDTPEFYPEIREAEELERMTLAELEQRQQMAAACAASPEAAPSGATGASAPALAPRSDSSESSSSTSSFEMSDGEAREALAAAAAERAMGARTIALVPTAVSDGEEDGEEDWGGWKVPKRSAFQAFCGLQQQIYRENGQESVYQLHMERNEPAPLAHGIYGSVDFLNELSRLGEPGYLAGMAAGRTDVIPLPPKDCEEEVVGVPPGYHSYMSPCYSHGLLYFGKPKVGDPPFMEHDDYLNLPFRRMDQAVLTTELEDHHAQILSQLTQAASAVDFGCNLKVITLVVNQLGESLTSNKSVHPKLLPMSYHLQQGHTFALYLLGLVNLYQENHEKYDIGHAERVTSETTPMWIQRCVWEIIGNVIKDEAKEHYSLEEYRASSKAARSKVFVRESWMELRGKPSEPPEVTGADYWNLHLVQGEPVGGPEPPSVPPLAVPTPPPIPPFRLPPRPPASVSGESNFEAWRLLDPSEAGLPPTPRSVPPTPESRLSVSPRRSRSPRRIPPNPELASIFASVRETIAVSESQLRDSSSSFPPVPPGL